MLCLPRCRFLNLQVGWTVPGDLRVGREGVRMAQIITIKDGYLPARLSYLELCPSNHGT